MFPGKYWQTLVKDVAQLLTFHRWRSSMEGRSVRVSGKESRTPEAVAGRRVEWAKLWLWKLLRGPAFEWKSYGEGLRLAIWWITINDKHKVSRGNLLCSSQTLWWPTLTVISWESGKEKLSAGLYVNSLNTQTCEQWTGTGWLLPEVELALWKNTGTHPDHDSFP